MLNEFSHTRYTTEGSIKIIVRKVKLDSKEL